MLDSVSVFCSSEPLYYWQFRTITELISVVGESKLTIFLDDGERRSVSEKGRMSSMLVSKLLTWYESIVDIPDKNPVDVNTFQSLYEGLDLKEFSEEAVSLVLSENTAGGDVSKKSLVLWLLPREVPERFLNSDSTECLVFNQQWRKAIKNVPIGLSENLTEKTVTHSSLWRVSKHNSDTVCLKKSVFRTRFRYADQVNKTLHEFVRLPRLYVKDLIQNRSCKEQVSDSESWTDPSPIKMFLRFVLEPFRAIWRSLLEALFEQDWNIAVVEESIEELDGKISERETNWLFDPFSTGFRADPFGLSSAGQEDVLFFEQYDNRSSKGTIRFSTLHNGIPSSPETFLEESEHLSYPFIFEQDGDYYCCPEKSESDRVVLYQFDPLTGVIQQKHTLFEGVKAIDPTPVRHDDLWWIFFTDAEKGPHSWLKIWWSEQLFDSWTPHRGNPVKMDVRSSRPAGTPFLNGGDLIRPSQDCVKEYGRAVVLNRITTLTPDCFDEIPVKRIEPSPNLTYLHGIHTISEFGDRTLIDGKRYRFSF